MRCDHQSLRHCLAFGVGLHHAGLQEEDRKVVENLFCDQKIQILVATRYASGADLLSSMLACSSADEILFSGQALIL